MGLLALGINHKSADVALREQVAFDPAHMVEALQQGLVAASLSELAVLSTCNRTEIFAIADTSDDNSFDLSVVEQQALKWLSNFHGLWKSVV